MKIIHLEAQNVKRLHAVEIDPKGNLIVIGGKNAAGKTSVLDSIAMAIGGAKAMPLQPIRRGATSAQIVLDLGDLIVTRRFTGTGPTLVVTNKEGVKQTSPQAILDELTSRVTFDPIAFIRMGPNEQAETLRRLVGIDFAALDAERGKAYNERTDTNRDAKNLELRISSMPHYPEETGEETAVAEVLERLEVAQSVNNENAEQRKGIDIANGLLAQSEASVLELEAKLKEAKKLLQQRLADRDKLVNDCKSLVDVDEAPIRKELSEADDRNAKLRANEARRVESKSLFEKKQRADELTAKLAQIDKKKADQIQRAKFPVEGLSFDEMGVLFKETPFAQASSAEQLRVSVAVGIAMNPKLKVLLIRDGSLLDEEGM